MKKIYILLTVALMAAVGAMLITSPSRAQVGHDWPPELTPVAPGVAVGPNGGGGGGNRVEYRYDPPDMPTVDGKAYKVCVTVYNSSGRIIHKSCTTYYGNTRGTLELPRPMPYPDLLSSEGISSKTTVRYMNLN